jgi:hypothetical protein
MMNCVEMNADTMMYDVPIENYEVGYYIGSSEMSEGEYSDDEMSVYSIKYCDKTDTNTDMDTNTIYVNNDNMNNDTCIIQMEA